MKQTLFVFLFGMSGALLSIPLQGFDNNTDVLDVVALTILKNRGNESEWIDFIEGMINAGSLNIDQQSSIGPAYNTLLGLAAQHNKINLVKCLIANKANVNGINKQGYAPLHLALKARHLHMARLLISNNASVDQQVEDTGATALSFAFVYLKKDYRREYMIRLLQNISGYPEARAQEKWLRCIQQAKQKRREALKNNANPPESAGAQK